MSTTLNDAQRKAALELREWARKHDRELFLRLQKRGLHKHFHHLIDPNDADHAKRYHFFRGGRGGGRTTSLSRVLVDLMADKKIRVCAARSFQNSIAESNKQAIEQQIEALGIGYRFDITRDYIEADTGALCVFRGLERNTQSIKSLEAIDWLWAEEAAGLTQKTISIVEPTIRKRGSKLIFSWNPEDESNAIEQLPVMYASDSAIRHTNYTQNPWCPQETINSANALKAHDYERYLHVFEGAYWSASEASIYGRRLVQYPFEIDESYGTPYIGVDWGFSQDPTAVTESYIRGRSLYIRRAAAKVRLELDDTGAWLKAKVPNISKYPSFADSARPETISKVALEIPRLQGVKKYAGSVEDGVAFMQSFEEIVIHPECQHDTISELRAYAYKVDNNDRITSLIIDANNHYADATRYGLAPMIKRRSSSSAPLSL